MTIIREPVLIKSAKRLGNHAEPQASAPEPLASQNQEALLASLREAFAEELEELREDARKEGLLASEAEVKAKLQALEAKQQACQQQEAKKNAALLASQQEAIAMAMKALQDEIHAVRAATQASALAIAYASVTKMLGELASSHVLLTRLVEQATQEHALGHDCTIAISGTDHALIPDLPPKFVVDDTLKAGDCIIRFAQGHIDAGLEHQLTTLKDIFLESLVHAHANA